MQYEIQEIYTHILKYNWNVVHQGNETFIVDPMKVLLDQMVVEDGIIKLYMEIGLGKYTLEQNNG